MKCAISAWSAIHAQELTEIGVRGRRFFFGAVKRALPTIAEAEYDFRSCRLLAAILEDLGGKIEALKRQYGSDRIAIVIGSSNTGINEAEAFVDEWLDAGKKPAGFRFSQIELGTPAEYLAWATGITGPCYTVSTACSSSAKTFSSASRLIETGFCDAAIVGGTDGMCEFALNGFSALGALSSGKCRPLAEDRDGISLGEGAALFLMERGGGDVYFAGAGETSDAYHATAPDPNGEGAELAIREAIANANLTPGDIDYVNLHGTGTLANDAMEIEVVRRVFGDDFKRYEATKRYTGHCLGAAGAVESAISIGKIAGGEVKNALSNSFAFGGANAAIVFTRG